MAVFGGSANSDVQKIMREIYEDHGKTLTAPIVVDVAAEPTHPLHASFEWDDERAGHQHRLGQARQLIRSCKVTFKDTSGVERRVNEYQSVIIRDPEGPRSGLRREERIRVYRATESVAKDAAAADALLRQFQMEWTAFRVRWESFAEFTKMFGPK